MRRMSEDFIAVLLEVVTARVTRYTTLDHHLVKSSLRRSEQLKAEQSLDLAQMLYMSFVTEDDGSFYERLSHGGTWLGAYYINLPLLRYIPTSIKRATIRP
jgi:hypothetical protein